MEGQKLSRGEGWELRLSRLLQDRLKAPFQWGMHDCAMFPCDAVQAITGVDPAASYRNTYSDEAGAAAIIADHGGMQKLFTDCMGFEPHGDYKQAKRGDMVFMNLGGNITGGIVDDTGARIAAVGINHMGLLRFPLSRAVLVWGY